LRAENPAANLTVAVAVFAAIHVSTRVPVAVFAGNRQLESLTRMKGLGETDHDCRFCRNSIFRVWWAKRSCRFCRKTRLNTEEARGIAVLAGNRQRVHRRGWGNGPAGRQRYNLTPALSLRERGAGCRFCWNGRFTSRHGCIELFRCAPRGWVVCQAQAQRGAGMPAGGSPFVSIYDARGDGSGQQRAEAVSNGHNISAGSSRNSALPGGAACAILV